MVSELGQVLKRAREDKQLTLEDIQRETKIQRRYLEAIEQGRFQALPGHFYVRAFIKSYAEAVGLNAEALFNEYINELPRQPQSEAVAPVRRRSSVSSSTGKVWSWLSPILLVVFIGLILFMIYYAVSHYQFASPEENRQADEMAPGTDLPEVDKGEGDTGQSQGSPYEETPSDQIDGAVDEKPSPTLSLIKQEGSLYLYDLTGADALQLTIGTRGRCWMQIRDKADGKVVFDAEMKAGNSQSWEMKETGEVWIWTGNAPAMDIKVNGIALDTSKFRTGKQYIWIKLKK